jgi:peptide/nickel transport system substrate-binding protein
MLKGAAGAGAGIATAAMIGCGRQTPDTGTPGAPDTTGSPGAEQIKRGGDVTRRHIGAGAFDLGLEPYRVSGNETGIMTLFYQTLIRPTLDDWAKVEPELAQRWEQPSQTEYVFQLNQGVKWHNKAPVNGRDLVAEDIVFSLNRARTDNPRFVNRSVLGLIDKIEAPNKSTVRITTKVPDVTTLLNIGDVTMLILAPEVFDRFETLTNAEHAIGTGAFILQSRDDVQAHMVRNPDFWKAGKPYVDSVRMQVIRDEGAAWSAFLTGQLDHVIVPGTEAKKFFEEQRGAGGKFDVEVSKATNTFFLMVNSGRPPFTDQRVQRALKLLMDHKEAIAAWAEVWFGSGTSYMLTHGMEAWDLTPQEYNQYLEWKQPKDEAAREAIAQLSAAGFNAGNPLKFEMLGTTQTQWNSAIAELQHGMWTRLAPNVIDAQLKMVDDATARQLESRRDFEVRAPTARASWFDPDHLFKAVFHSAGSQNYAQYKDPAIDQMIDRQRTLFDETERKTAIKEIVRHLIENAPYSPFASRDWPNAWQKRLKNFAPEVGRVRGYKYEQVWLDT